MILQYAKFSIRLTEKPIIRIKAEDGKEEIKDWGLFRLGKKYLVLGLYDDGEHPTALLLADENRELRWISMNICRKA